MGGCGTHPGEERQTDCESVSFHTPARQFSTVPVQGGSEHTNVGFCGQSSVLTESELIRFHDSYLKNHPKVFGVKVVVTYTYDQRFQEAKQLKEVLS